MEEGVSDARGSTCGFKARRGQRYTPAERSSGFRPLSVERGALAVPSSLLELWTLRSLNVPAAAE